MIHVYAMCYWILPYAQKTIDNMLKTASEPLHITVVEGRSKNSPEFLEWGKQCLREGKIQNFITADGNCKGSGLTWAYDNCPADASEDFVIFTDLDLLVPEGCNWVGMIKDTMAQGIIVSGFQLSAENYVPPNWGWTPEEPGFGNWHLAIKKYAFDTFPRSISFQDYKVIGHALQYGYGHQIKQRILHLGWDAWKDDEIYWKEKCDNMDWQSSKDEIFNYTVYTKDNI